MPSAELGMLPPFRLRSAKLSGTRTDSSADQSDLVSPALSAAHLDAAFARATNVTTLTRAEQRTATGIAAFDVVFDKAEA
jgi:hypothetical protein